MGPAPMTMRCAGQRLRSKIVSLVRYGVSVRPAIAGTAGREPVATTKRRALISKSPTATVLVSVKRAAPWITCTPSAGEALLGVVRRDRRDHAAHMRVDLCEVDLDALQLEAERRHAARRGRVLRGGEQRLGGNAAVVEAVAAHLAFLDQHDRYAESSRGGRDRQPAGAGADHADVGGQKLGHEVRRRAVSGRSARGRASRSPG